MWHSLQKAFPEGEYTFTGSTSSGAQFKDKTTLSHKLPPTTSFVSPDADARNVVAKDLKISWAPVKNVAGYTIELDATKPEAHLEMKLSCFGHVIRRARGHSRARRQVPASHRHNLSRRQHLGH